MFNPNLGPFTGRWKIAEMDTWSEDMINEFVQPRSTSCQTASTVTSSSSSRWAGSNAGQPSVTGSPPSSGPGADR